MLFKSKLFLTMIPARLTGRNLRNSTFFGKFLSAYNEEPYKGKVGRASLLYKWQGSDETLKPIAFLSHMDVVPISDGTLGDWTHPPFDGFNDGEYVWGRGALDMKTTLCVLWKA